MRALIVAAAAAVATLVTMASGAVAAPLANAGFSETVEVTIVYVGIEEGEIDTRDVEADLPTRIDPKIRYKLFYEDRKGADLGTRYDLRYAHSFAGTSFENALAAFLRENAAAQLAKFPQAATPTLFQQQYNTQKSRIGDPITTNKWIDGPATENKLGDLATAAGIDVTKPTIFFVNASGIGPHVYVKTDVVDPDTGYNFGVVRASRKMSAWGGFANDDAATSTDRRVWFYDLSAGPESWTSNWNVDDADIDGDGARDYRIPPIWHYLPRDDAKLWAAHPGYPAATLGADLGRVTRYVALNLLFASSPLYPPYFQPNRIPSSVVLDVNTVEWWNNVDVSARFIKPSFIQTAINGLPAGPSVTVGPNQDLPFSGDWARCYQGFSSDKKLCFNDLAAGFYLPFANPFLAAARNLSSFLPAAPVDTYRAALVNYGVGAKPKTPQGLLGFADDNWLNGTQSGVFSFVYPEVVPLGYGMTTTMTHEYGHHSSMSHPHDGFDWETWDAKPDDPTFAFDYGPSGDTNLAWLGDMSDSIMSYMDLADGFSQFDQDNSARHHAAGYAKIANALATKIAGPLQKLADADAKLGDARKAWRARAYSRALLLAKAAYEDVVAASGGLDKVEIQSPSTWTIAGPVKPGNGNKNQKAAAYARDLEERHNVKRVYSK